MYSMNLDSVREKSTNNQIMAEVSLMRAALMGNPAVLSPNQAIDSIVLQEIILNNNKNDFQNNGLMTFPMSSTMNNFNGNDIKGKTFK